MSTHKGLLHHLNINVSDVARSSGFYSQMFQYFGYERTDFAHDRPHPFEDWKRWDLDTPHEISICQGDVNLPYSRADRRGIGRHNHIAFCALDREDVDRFYTQVLIPAEAAGLCVVEDAPCDCPEYGEGYYATFFFDPDGLKYEYVINPNYLRKKRERVSE